MADSFDSAPAPEIHSRKSELFSVFPWALVELGKFDHWRLRLNDCVENVPATDSGSPGGVVHA